MKIKICGITNAADAELALDEGADLLGFIFCRSARTADPLVVRDIVRRMPGTKPGVGVFLDQPLDEVKAVLAQTGLPIAQLHGSETPEYAAALGVPVIKTFTAFTPEALETLRRFDSWAYLLDLPKGMATRASIDPDWALCAKKYGKVIASGRLMPDTVHEIIHRVRPFGVDSASGTEASPGRKDPGRVRAFIQAARTADSDSQRIKVTVR